MINPYVYEDFLIKQDSVLKHARTELQLASRFNNSRFIL
ncbi:hypothetical protein LEP1GSC060_0387 [Leptospira weilii serovar Ranarum str. ICFT]|uniref:Uncharacterized protein n=1 Tax=Leptospira weilii serovar Ranarum str. ICFT TaxID=1218598 RepID=N1WHH8_9LEPT|nr:hypothetical protein LEP1GSC060_0387 [Leptospira weilii serovar Ranarum str. ICFT]